MSKPFGHDLQNEGSLERSQERMRINSDPKRIAEQSAHLRKIMGLPPKDKAQ